MSDDGRVRVCRVDELPPGSRRIVDLDGRSIGVFNIGGTFHALLNRCPHRGAPLCEGRVTGVVSGDRPGEFRLDRDGEVVTCPWHGWEFDITTGKSVFNPHRVRARRFPVSVELDPDDRPGLDAKPGLDCGPDPEHGPDPSVPSFPAHADRGWVVVTLRRAPPGRAELAATGGPPA